MTWSVFSCGGHNAHAVANSTGYGVAIASSCLIGAADHTNTSLTTKSLAVIFWAVRLRTMNGYTGKGRDMNKPFNMPNRRAKLTFELHVAEVGYAKTPQSDHTWRRYWAQQIAYFKDAIRLYGEYQNR